MVTPDLYLLHPPYEGGYLGRPLAATGACPPLGSVVPVIGGELPAALEALARPIATWPWLAPCLVRKDRSEHTEELLRLMGLFGLRVAVAYADECATPAGRGAVTAAVRQRPAPTAQSLAAFLAGRLARPDLVAPLLDQFAASLQPGDPPGRRSAATYSRLFSRAGSLHAHDFRALGRLVRFLYTATTPDSRAGDRVQPPVPQRAARRHARRYLAMPLHAALAYAGWEWVLEQTLRVAGYVSPDGSVVVAPPPPQD